MIEGKENEGRGILDTTGFGALEAVGTCAKAKQPCGPLGGQVGWICPSG